jgi:hypothetical protein
MVKQSLDPLHRVMVEPPWPRPRSKSRSWPTNRLHLLADAQAWGGQPGNRPHGPKLLTSPQDGEPRRGASARGMPPSPMIRPPPKDPGQMQLPPGQGLPSRPLTTIIFLDVVLAAPSKRIAATSTSSTLGTRGPPPPRSTPATAAEWEVIGEEYFGRQDLAPAAPWGAPREGGDPFSWERSLYLGPYLIQTNMPTQMNQIRPLWTRKWFNLLEML